MADHALPTVDDSYTNWLAMLKSRDDDIARGLDPAHTTATNLANYSVRWNSANSYWEILNGSTWQPLTAQYQIDVASLGGTPASGWARLASPAFTGSPQAPVAPAGDNTTRVAVTSWVQTELANKASLASPIFVGIPQAPTAAVDTGNTQIATTAFVINQGYMKRSQQRGRNIVTGGDFTVNPWQRCGGSIVHAFPINGNISGQDYIFGADRWAFAANGANAWSMYRQLDHPTFAQCGRGGTHCLTMFCTTAQGSIGAGNYAVLTHRIMGWDYVPYYGRQLTISFWHKFSKPGVYGCYLSNVADRSVAQTFTQLSSNVWERAQVTFPAPPTSGTWNFTNGIGLQLAFTLMAGSSYISGSPGAWTSGSILSGSGQANGADSTSNQFSFALVQLESGTDSTDYEVLSQSDTLLRCLPFYQKTFIPSIPPANGQGDYAGALKMQFAAASTTGNVGTDWEFAAGGMRAAPAITTYNPRAGGNIGMWTDTSSDYAAQLFNVGAKRATIAFFDSGLLGTYYINATATADL